MKEWASQVALVVKNLPASVGRCKRHRFSPWVRKIPLEEGTATHSSILAWRIPWTEEPGGLQAMESQRGHDWNDSTHTHTHTCMEECSSSHSTSEVLSPRKWRTPVTGVKVWWGCWRVIESDPYWPPSWLQGVAVKLKDLLLHVFSCPLPHGRHSSGPSGQTCVSTPKWTCLPETLPQQLTLSIHLFLHQVFVSTESQASFQVPGRQPWATHRKPQLFWVFRCVLVLVGFFWMVLTSHCMGFQLPLAPDSSNCSHPDQLSCFLSASFLECVTVFVTTFAHFSFPLGSPDPTWPGISHLKNTEASWFGLGCKGFPHHL